MTVEWEVRHGDALAALRTVADCTVDAVVTDPPAGIAFMGKEWDDYGAVQRGRTRSEDPEKNTKGLFPGYGRGGRPEDRLIHARRSRVAFIDFLTRVMAECLRVMKPGGHALVWALPRTSHWTATAIEDAGFEIRDSIHHVFGTGFLKGGNVAKSIQKANGVQPVARKEASLGMVVGPNADQWNECRTQLVMPEPEGEAAEWDGWNTSLAPGHEVWWLARKPLSEGTVAANVLKWGVGGLNVSACRGQGGRLPKNIVFSHAEGCEEGSCVEGCAVAALDEQAGVRKSGEWKGQKTGETGSGVGAEVYGKKKARTYVRAADSGFASRFFYVAKPSSLEKNAGLPEGMRNTHPTSKGISLMRYLCKMVTPSRGVVLDCFCGSGTTGCAAVLEGFSFAGVEQDAGYAEIARARIAHWAGVAAKLKEGAA